MKKNVSVVVLAAGKGKRMNSDLPKVLLPVLGRPMLFYVLDNISFAEDIIVVGGFGFDLLSESLADRKGIKIARQEKQLGTADAVKSALPFINGSCEYVLIVCGDMPLLKLSSIERLVDYVVLNNLAGGLLFARATRQTSLGRVRLEEKNGFLRALEIIEKADLNQKEDIDAVNTGCYVFKKKFLEDALPLIANGNKQKEFYLTDVVAIARGKGEFVAALECDFSEALGANSRRDLADIEAVLLRKKINSLFDKGVVVRKPDSVYIEWEAEVGRGTEILPFTVIRRDVVIGENCAIGPFAHIRPGTRIGDNVTIGDFVEVNRTEMASGAQAKHLSYLGDAKIGKGVNIGAGVITANYDGRNKNATEVGHRAFIGSGAVLVAPCVVREDAVLGAGAVLTRNKEVKKGQVFVGVPAKELKSVKKEESVDG